jgi:hypothetical protein
MNSGIVTIQLIDQDILSAAVNVIPKFLFKNYI